MDSIEKQASDLLNASSDFAEAMMALVVTYAFSVLGAIILLIVGWIVAAIAQRSVKTAFMKFDNVDKTLAGFFGAIARYGILTIVIVMVLGQFGVQTASTLAALGAAGLAIGLALQGTLQNIAAGIMLLVLRPFKVGEYISTGSIDGTVQEVRPVRDRAQDLRRPLPARAEFDALECLDHQLFPRCPAHARTRHRHRL